MKTKDILIMLHNMLETYQNLCSPRLPPDRNDTKRF